MTRWDLFIWNFIYEITLNNTNETLNLISYKDFLTNYKDKKARLCCDPLR